MTRGNFMKRATEFLQYLSSADLQVGLAAVLLLLLLLLLLLAARGPANQPAAAYQRQLGLDRAAHVGRGGPHDVLQLHLPDSGAAGAAGAGTSVSSWRLRAGGLGCEQHRAGHERHCFR
jgi:hypothetical protein